MWHAHDEQLDRAVALKRIPLPWEEDRERATRESRATARLSHPAIVALYEATSDDDAFYLVSELVLGETLAQMIAEDRLCDEEVLEIGLSLVQALEHAHARGVIHRDVKPQNVLVPNAAVEQTPSRGASPAVAKLADFGGARLAGDEALTRTGDVFGTLAYMAPEQSEGHEAGPPADLYSLALVLYEALTGVNPVRGRTPAATARRIGAPIEPLQRRRRDLPRGAHCALDRRSPRRPPIADARARFAGARTGAPGRLQDRAAPGPERRRFPAWVLTSIKPPDAIATARTAHGRAQDGHSDAPTAPARLEPRLPAAPGTHVTSKTERLLHPGGWRCRGWCGSVARFGDRRGGRRLVAPGDRCSLAAAALPLALCRARAGPAG